MTHVRETLYIMDGATTTFGKQPRISISRNLLILIILAFIGCIVATGLLVYTFTTCPSHNAAQQQPMVILNYTVAQEDTSATSTTESLKFTSESTTESISTSSSPINLELNKNNTDVRLPRSLVPILYDLEIIPFIFEGNFTFHGLVNILLRVKQATNNITLHINDLSILSSDVKVFDTAENLEFQVKNLTRDLDKQFFIIHLNDFLVETKQYNVSIRYKGILNDQLQGFYRSSYKDENGVQ